MSLDRYYLWYLTSPYYITGDGIIDNEEFEYVLSEFGCSERVARQAFTIVTKVSSLLNLLLSSKTIRCL